MFTIEYVLSPIGLLNKALHAELARSEEEARAKAKSNLPAMRVTCGAQAYRILDPTGHRIAIGPGSYESEFLQFRPVELKDGSSWYVAYTPDDYGPTQHVHSFASEEEAQAWIDRESEAWLSKRRA